MRLLVITLEYDAFPFSGNGVYAQSLVRGLEQQPDHLRAAVGGGQRQWGHPVAVGRFGGRARYEEGAGALDLVGLRRPVERGGTVRSRCVGTRAVVEESADDVGVAHADRVGERERPALAAVAVSAVANKRMIRVERRRGRVTSGISNPRAKTRCR